MTTTRLIPRSVLFGNPERVAPQISPDGTRLAWIAPSDGVLNVWVSTIGQDDARVVTSDRDRGVRVYFWAPDDRRILFVQDRGGDENWRLYDVDLETDVVRDLTPFDDMQVQVVGVDAEVPDRILVGINKDDPTLHDVYDLQLADGSLTRVVQNPGGLIGFVADGDLQVRAAVAPQPDGGTTLMVRDDVQAPWRPLLQVAQQDALTTAPIAFNQAGDRLLVISPVEANAARLLWVELATGAIEVLAGDQMYDVADVVTERRTHAPVMVAFERDRQEWQALDPRYEGDLKALQALDAGDLSIVSADREQENWVVAYDHDDGPARYYAYDRTSREGTFLFENRPELSDAGLSPMEPFSFTARDGLVVHGYLTFPAGKARENLPAVLNVHGGPWARDGWGLVPEAQWLANRGYLCVQVNFRGSTGYGKAFLNAGDREWGAAMHDDIVDAVAWIVDQGYADASRIGIYGGSYGGYAALVGAAFTPDLFRCAVDIVGPSNLKTLIESIPPYWEPLVAEFHTRVGNPETEPEFLWSRSPLSRAGDIRIPLLIAQGANDPRVKQAESEQIVDALTERGIAHEYLLFPDEGHGFAKPENRLRFYAAAERFLATHLGGELEPDDGTLAPVPPPQ